MKAKKSLGQNFLKSEAALKAIIAASDPATDDVVLEIGPGEGVLTERLLAFAGKVIAIEKDHRLIPLLKEKFKKEIKEGKFDLIEADVLELPEEFFSIFSKGKSAKPRTENWYGAKREKNSSGSEGYKIVANIPYYITGQVIRQFLTAENQPESMTLLVQKEVAQRIVAKDKKESLLSISVKAYGDPYYVKTVPRGAFSPMPNVDSAIISIRNINKNRFKDSDASEEAGVEENKFFEILHQGFAHKRKLLIKNLLALSKSNVGTLKEVFEKCGISEKARAENLSVKDWICLARELT